MKKKPDSKNGYRHASPSGIDKPNLFKIMEHLVKKICLLLVLAGTTSWALAQDGIVRGKVVDKATGEALMFANVIVLQTDPPIGTETDLDGQFELTLPAGTYDLQASYIGFPDQVLTGIVVEAGQTTVLDFFMESQVQELNVVEVAAERVDRSEVALIALRKKAPGITDNLSAQEMARFGSANAAESMKRVTGASVQDGRYIVVRGLGDRYSSAQLNGMPLPSNDPYRNSTQHVEDLHARHAGQLHGRQRQPQYQELPRRSHLPGWRVAGLQHTEHTAQ